LERYGTVAEVPQYLWRKAAGGGRNAIIFPGLGASEANDALFRCMSGGGTQIF
jgi:hypothetical protein